MRVDAANDCMSKFDLSDMQKILAIMQFVLTSAVRTDFIPTYKTDAVGYKTKIFLLIPLAAFACVILGFGMYMTLCKNSNIPLPC